jgi:hypothetical protein
MNSVKYSIKHRPKLYKKEKYGKNNEDCLPLVSLQYYRSRRRDLGRPKQKWKDQHHLQDQEKHVLLDLNTKYS